MRRFCLSLLVVVALAAPAHATTCNVMAYGDSTTLSPANPPGSYYPLQLQALRPDLTVYNYGLGADNSSNLTRFRSALADRTWSTVVILIGVNDYNRISAAATVENIRYMTQLAKQAGATPVVMTILPFVCFTEGGVFCLANLGREAFRVAVNDLLVPQMASDRVAVVDSRARVNTAVWRNGASDEGLHPNVLGAALLAGLASRAIPHC